MRESNSTSNPIVTLCSLWGFWDHGFNIYPWTPSGGQCPRLKLKIDKKRTVSRQAKLQRQLWNFEDNLWSKGIIIWYTSKPERGLYVIFVEPAQLISEMHTLYYGKDIQRVMAIPWLQPNKCKLTNLLEFIQLWLDCNNQDLKLSLLRFSCWQKIAKLLQIGLLCYDFVPCDMFCPMRRCWKNQLNFFLIYTVTTCKHSLPGKLVNLPGLILF